MSLRAGTHRLARLAIAAAFALTAAPLTLHAQEDVPLRLFAQEDAPLPPRILDDEPGEASLAQLPPERTEVIEEIVVVGSSEWRLPDLGASWRIRYERRPTSRVAARVLPLYDPEMAELWPDLFQLSKQEERTGNIELFRIRFGARARETIVPTVLNPDP